MSHSVIRVTLMLLGVVMVPAVHADRQVIAPGTGPQDTVVVDSGANGICETRAHRDDLPVIPVGQGMPFGDEIRCGPDRIASAAAGGDDVQLMAVGAPCPNAGTVVVDSGANGIAETRAQGADLVMLPARSVRVVIRRGQGSASKRVKVAVVNAEFGTPSAASRVYLLSA